MGFNGNVLRGYPTVQRGFNGNVCPEGVQNKCPGGVWCRGFMTWGDTLILVISRGVQLFYGIAHCKRS